MLLPVWFHLWCASLALAPLPLIFSYKSEQSLRGTGRGANSNNPGPAEFYEAGQADRCYKNRCIQRQGGSWAHGAYAILWGCNASIGGGSCAPPGKAVMGVYGNQIYRESGRSCPFSSGCDVACGMGSSNASMLSMADFQAKCGLGDGAAVHPVPSATEIAAWSRELLAIPTLPP